MAVEGERISWIQFFHDNTLSAFLVSVGTVPMQYALHTLVLATKYIVLQDYHKYVFAWDTRTTHVLISLALVSIAKVLRCNAI